MDVWYALLIKVSIINQLSNTNYLPFSYEAEEQIFLAVELKSLGMNALHVLFQLGC